MEKRYMALLALYSALLFGPVVWIIHKLLFVLDTINRYFVRRHQEAWPFKTTPHVREKLVAPPPSDIASWHLVTEEGRQRWEFRGKGSGKVPDHTFVEKYHLGIAPASQVRPARSPLEALENGAAFLMKLQHPTSGHWPNDYSGPMFLLPGAIFVKFIIARGDVSKMFKFPQQRTEFIRYLRNMQNADGGWGMHTESHSTMFGTVLNFVSLRLLGVDANDSAAKSASRWILERGGALSIPSWGKVWLCVLGLYEYDGINSIPPELSVLPDWLPFSQGMYWCHARIVTTPFSWFYGKRWKADSHPLLEIIKTEIYVQPYAKIPWAKHRSDVYGPDIYTPHSWVYKVANQVLLAYEKVHSKKLRDIALTRALEHIRYDDESTDYICLGPVNKVLDMLITWLVDGEDSTQFKRHVERLEDYFYIGNDGLRMSGYNGSQLWDTSFAVQAAVACGVEQQFEREMAKAYHYIDVAQVREDPPAAHAFYRSRTKGAWNFSTRAQSWQVSDCTAEGLRVALLLRNKLSVLRHTETMDDSRLFDGVDEILDLRWADGDGGWGSYEAPRGPRYLELLNCSEIYKDIMVDYTYSECSSSCVHTLCLFRKQFPQYRVEEVNRAIDEGSRYVVSKQGVDGSFYGSWAVCFTYGAWIVTDALHMAGFDETSLVFKKACAFLLAKQRSDGGWGEDFNSCVRQVWVENPDGSQVVNTAWAVMALMAAGGAAHRLKVDRGIRFIMSRQLANGDWPQERISGVFNGNAAIHYPGYKNSMPVWALGKYAEWQKVHGASS
jgi:lanosterol synthase